MCGRRFSKDFGEFGSIEFLKVRWFQLCGFTIFIANTRWQTQGGRCLLIAYLLRGCQCEIPSRHSMIYDLRIEPTISSSIFSGRESSEMIILTCIVSLCIENDTIEGENSHYMHSLLLRQVSGSPKPKAHISLFSWTSAPEAQEE